MNIFPCDGHPEDDAQASNPIRVNKKDFGGKGAKRFYERFERELIVSKETNQRNKKSLKKIKQDLAKEKQAKQFSKIDELIEKVNHLQLPQCKQQFANSKKPSKSDYSNQNIKNHSNKFAPFYYKLGKQKNKISLSREKRQSHEKLSFHDIKTNILPSGKMVKQPENDAFPLTVQSILSEQIYEEECQKNYMIAPWNNPTQPETPFLSKNLSRQSENDPQNKYLEKYSLRFAKK